MGFAIVTSEVASISSGSLDLDIDRYENCFV